MAEPRDPADDEVGLPAQLVLAHVDLVAQDEFREPGTKAGTGPRVPESGVRFGIPLICPMEMNELPPWLGQPPQAGPYRYLGLIITFDLDELPGRQSYTQVRCAVKLSGDGVMAVDVQPDGAARTLNDRLKPLEAPTRRWLLAPLRQHSPRHAATASGLRTSTFGCAYRDSTGDLLTSRSYTMIAIVAAPSWMTELTGCLTAEAEIARPSWGIITRRTAATAEATHFAVSVPRIVPTVNGTTRAIPAPATDRPDKVELRIGFTVDVVGYSRRTQSAQHDVQERLVRGIEAILADVGLALDARYTQRAGDGMHVFLPADVDIRRVPRLVHAAVDWLARDNEKHTDHMRWRMAIDSGPVGRAPAGFIGDAIISFCRLVNSHALQQAMDDHPSADLALLVSEQIYNDVMRQDYFGPAAAEFWKVRVTVKEYAADAWLWVAPEGVRHRHGRIL